jgi:hypothetical protein
MNIFRLALPMALTFAMSVSVFADDDDDLAPRGGTGTITIITDPPNSDVFLDGENLGKSPIEKRKFRSGPLKLIIMDHNKELINTRFNVWPNKENRYEGKTIMPLGTIKVMTTPDKCRVLLDDEIADRTDGGPLTLNSVEAGDHTVGVEGCGKSFKILIPVRGEQTTEVHLNVKTQKGTAKIDGEDVTEDARGSKRKK